ncbi:hypothetical protein E0765_01635 [Sulfuricurvum sp. IAE1]|uniref:hypothetical protein n=1 Tax=Sulfuricurvum sp. IAE1 TaxID=2546102 RepID=UPI00104A974B|nr:hypothetical protein [Sulfuricurvum sp. IAE1]TDA69145.1 hypothetical protein E0765_01635 [Sulfuricurvum sp. IAE1]
MKAPKFFTFAFVAIVALGTPAVSAQQSFQLSSKFLEARFSGKQQVWDGQHHFGNVLCLKFPRANDAEALAEAMYNNNTLYFSRTAYNDMTALYVVASTIPAGRSAEVEIGNLAAQNQKNVDAYPEYFKLTQVPSLLGSSLVLTVRNSLEGPKELPFPFARSVANRPDGQLASLSVHRLFVHGQNRIEVAGLRYFKVPVNSEQEAEAVSALSALVEEAAESLQSCTAKLPLEITK